MTACRLRSLILLRILVSDSRRSIVACNNGNANAVISHCKVVITDWCSRLILCYGVSSGCKIWQCCRRSCGKVNINCIRLTVSGNRKYVNLIVCFSRCSWNNIFCNRNRSLCRCRSRSWIIAIIYDNDWPWTTTVLRVYGYCLWRCVCNSRPWIVSRSRRNTYFFYKVITVKQIENVDTITIF